MIYDHCCRSEVLSSKLTGCYQIQGYDYNGSLHYYGALTGLHVQEDHRTAQCLQNSAQPCFLWAMDQAPCKYMYIDECWGSVIVILIRSSWSDQFFIRTKIYPKNWLDLDQFKV